MGERISSTQAAELPELKGWSYSSLGNRHTYVIDSEGKSRVISRAAFSEQFSAPQSAASTVQPENNATSLTISKEYAKVPARRQIKQKQNITLPLERNHHMSEKFANKPDMSKDVDEAFGIDRPLTGEEEWANYLEYRRNTQGYADENGNIRDAEGNLKQDETAREHANRLYDDESRQETVYENMGLVSLAKAAKEANERGDKTSFMHLQDEVQEKLIASAEKNGWTDEQTSGMLDRLIAVMHGEADSTDNEPVANTEIEAVIEDAPSEEQAEPVVEQKVASPAEMRERLAASGIFAESAIGGLSDAQIARLYKENSGKLDASEQSSESSDQDDDKEPIYGPHLNEAIAPKEELVYGPHLNEVVVDTEGEPKKGETEVLKAITPEEAETDKKRLEAREDYELALEEYIETQAQARGTILSSVIDKVATFKLGGWANRLRGRDTKEAERNAASERYEAAFREFKPYGFEEYYANKELELGAERAAMEDLDRMYDLDIIHETERWISEKRIELDKGKNRGSRWLFKAGGLVAATGAGALIGAMDGQASGRGLLGGLLLGATAGFAAEKMAGNDNTEEDIEARQGAAAKNYEETGSVVEAIDINTTEEQGHKRNRVLGMAAVGAAVAGAAYGLSARDVLAPGVEQGSPDHDGSGDGSGTANAKPTVPIEQIETGEPDIAGFNPEALNQPFEVEYGNGVTQELAQQFEALGLPVPPPSELNAIVTSGIDLLGSDGVMNGVNLVPSPDGTEMWIDKPGQATWTPDFIKHVFNSTGK